MIITHRINMDLERRGTMPQIEAVQDDRYTRDIAITLTAGGTEWVPPEGSGIVVRYQKPDGNGGEYDTLPDGSAACAVSGNVVTISLAPQMLTVVGAVTVTVGFVYGDQEISTFGFLINVRPNVGAQIAESEPYFNIQYYLPQPDQAEQGQYLQVASINERGVVTQVKAISGPATPIKGVDYFTEAEISAVAENAAGLVTPDLIGAAPAGFGLGGTSAPTVSDINTHKVNGWFRVTVDTANTPCNYGVGICYCYSPVNIIQNVYDVVGRNWLRRVTTDSGATWGAWEYTDPPMEVGVEYRTTERWQGKTVYTKLIDFGALPASNRKGVNTGIAASNMISIDGVASKAEGTTISLPLIDTENGTIAAAAITYQTYLYVYAFKDMSAYSAVFRIRYTKD